MKSAKASDDGIAANDTSMLRYSNGQGMPISKAEHRARRVLTTDTCARPCGPGHDTVLMHVNVFSLVHRQFGTSVHEFLLEYRHEIHVQVQPDHAPLFVHALQREARGRRRACNAAC